jgi:hypothetical protein
MKTAVEWLVDELLSGRVLLPHLIEQAKEMEKEQIKKAWIDGNYNIDSNGNPSQNYAISDERYYNETFKSE